MTHNLKPCPFCGSKAVLSKNTIMIKGVNQKCAWVYCPTCGSRTNYYRRDVVAQYCMTAIDAWNRRPLQKLLTLEDLQPDAVVWIEFKDNREECHLALIGYNDLIGGTKLYYKVNSTRRHFVDDWGYNVYWRAWASKPTAEERAAVEWEEE